MDLTGLTAAAFLDVHGRFAKRAEDVVEVRLFFYGDATPTHTLTVEAFDALTPDEREQIRNTGSGAGFVDTSGKSNA